MKPLSFFFLFVLALQSQAQLNTVNSASIDPASGSVTGQVLTTDQKPAAGVTILLKPSQRMTVTDEAGIFLIRNLKEGTYVLDISMIGLVHQEKAFVIQGGETVSVSIVLYEDNRQLNEVVIRTQRNNNNQPVSVGKIEISPMNLPQSIAVVGQSTIRDQQALRLSDVIRNVNGVYLSSTRAGTQENFSARGYSFSSSNLFKNGARINTGAMPEVSSLEKVEVLKGSAAILFGNVAPGGIVNMITKQPRFDRGGEVSMRAGSYRLLKPTIDFYGPLSNSIAFRVNGTYENAGSFRKEVNSERMYVNPSLLIKPGKGTELLIQGDYLRHDFTPDFGIGSIDNTKIAPLSRDAYPGASWSYAHTRQATASANLRQKLTENWKLNVQTSFQRYSRDYYATERIQASANGAWARPLGRTDTRENYFLAQADINGKFSTGKVSHQLLAGMDADHYLTHAYTFNQPAFYDTINILDPSTYAKRNDIPRAEAIRMVATPTIRFGAYVQDLISLSEKWKLLAGVRWTYQEGRRATTTNLQNGSETMGVVKVDKAFSPRAGLVYRPLRNTSFFVSYSNSFSVNSGTDVYGNALTPSVIDQYEAGVKNEWFDGKFAANVTVYRILNNNLAQTARFQADGITVNNNTSLKELTGQTTSDGIELDLNAHPAKGFDIIAGYSYNYMRYTKTPDAKGNFIEGERLIGTPAHTANTSVFYVLRSTQLKGLKLGATAQYTGRRNAGFNNTIGQTQNFSRLFSVEGYTTVDLSAGYTHQKLSLLVKLSNITNTLNYYVHENYSINPIPPRQIVATVAYRF